MHRSQTSRLPHCVTAIYLHALGPTASPGRELKRVVALALNDEQRNLVLDAAQHIPGVWRTRFVEGVIDRLFFQPEVTNNEVHEATRYVAQRMMVNLTSS